MVNLEQQVWIGPMDALEHALEPYVDKSIKALAESMGPKRQQSVLVGRTLLKFVLIANGIIEHNGLLPEIAYTPLRKPFFIDLPVHFNLSHSHGWIALAVGAEPQGLDLELIDLKRTLRPALLKRVLMPPELRYLHALQAQPTAESSVLASNSSPLCASSYVYLGQLNSRDMTQLQRIVCSDDANGTKDSPDIVVDKSTGVAGLEGAEVNRLPQGISCPRAEGATHSSTAIALAHTAYTAQHERANLGRLAQTQSSSGLALSTQQESTVVLVHDKSAQSTSLSVGTGQGYFPQETGADLSASHTTTTSSSSISITTNATTKASSNAFSSTASAAVVGQQAVLEATVPTKAEGLNSSLSEAASNFFFLQWTVKECLLKLQGSSIFALERLQIEPELRKITVQPLEIINGQEALEKSPHELQDKAPEQITQGAKIQGQTLALAAHSGQGKADLPWFKHLFSYKLSTLLNEQAASPDFWLTVGAYGEQSPQLFLFNSEQSEQAKYPIDLEPRQTTLLSTLQASLNAVVPVHSELSGQARLSELALAYEAALSCVTSGESQEDERAEGTDGDIQPDRAKHVDWECAESGDTVGTEGAVRSECAERTGHAIETKGSGQDVVCSPSNLEHMAERAMGLKKSELVGTQAIKIGCGERDLLTWSGESGVQYGAQKTQIATKKTQKIPSFKKSSLEKCAMRGADQALKTQTQAELASFKWCKVHCCADMTYTVES